MEEFIDKENAVRFVDAFVEQLELDKLGFQIAPLKTEGSPSFNPKVFLKLCFYGYLNGLRSSQKLAKLASQTKYAQKLKKSLKNQSYLTE